MSRNVCDWALPIVRNELDPNEKIWAFSLFFAVETCLLFFSIVAQILNGSQEFPVLVGAREVPQTKGDRLSP
jgi:hypothetical protein